ncbi:MAG TPA: lamin tail domain-containing protein, partial [Methylomirabilota bacterium]|nr:lamin tail domain-containing protein [Methylomirabilota bacterium]
MLRLFLVFFFALNRCVSVTGEVLTQAPAVIQADIVINEIMYHHKIIPALATNLPPQENPEAWIELYNRGPNTVDLSDWELTGGVDYRFDLGRMIAPGAYLIVADDLDSLRAAYPGLDIVGNLGGRLSHNNDRIVLRDPLGNPADQVHYYAGSRWPDYPDGGGSSLELRDPDADNSKPEAWAASDETGKSSWQYYIYKGPAIIPPGSGQPTTWNDFILGLQGAGECLIDDINVIEAPTGAAVPFIANGNFENGMAGWRVLGTHNRSQVIDDPESPGNHVLHLVATGPQEHMHNHIEATFISGRTITAGREYQISYRAKWLAGNHLLNTRLYFNRVGRTMSLVYPQRNGTPGAQNSRYAPNVGPTFSDLVHQPVVPALNEPVTVSVAAQDPEAVDSAILFWSVNSGVWNDMPMTGLVNGRLTATIPGQSAGAVVQFYVQANDGLGATATFPARGPQSGALYKVNDGQADLNLAHNIRLILTPANIDLMHGTSQGVNQTNVMSNDLLPCTVIYDERLVYYDCGVHLRGSERGRYSDVRTGFHINFHPDDLFRGTHPVMLIDRSGAGDATANRQEDIVLKHMLNRAGGLAGNYLEICRVLAPRAAHTGPAQLFPRLEDNYLETAFEDGGSSPLYEMELIYYPTTANAAGYKNPQPDSVIGTDLTNLGEDKEFYRYNFMLKNQREADDYSGLVALGKAWALNGAALDSQTRQLMDLDQCMRSYAFMSLCSVGDIYSFGNNHNVMLYARPADGKFLFFATDIDFAFSRGANGALVGDQNLGKIVNLTGNLRLLYAHMLDIINISFNSAYMAYWTDHYDNFAPGQNYSGLLTTIGARVPYVVGQINAAGGNAAFAVNGASPIVTGSNLVTLTGTAPVTMKTITINGVEYPITWTTISAWTITFPVSSPTNDIVVEGRDISGVVVTSIPRSVVFTNSVPNPRDVIVFNEIMYNPAVPDASYVELFNTSSNASFDLSGWRINGLAFTFPPGKIITPRQYLVIAGNAPAYAGAYGVAGGVAAGEFLAGNLQNDGETLTLLKPAASSNEVDLVVDRVRYESVLPWSAQANGTGSALQLIDPNQENARVANWFANYVPPVFCCGVSTPATTNDGWRFASLS